MFLVVMSAAAAAVVLGGFRRIGGGNSLFGSLKADFGMGAVAEGLINRTAAAAERESFGTRAADGITFRIAQIGGALNKIRAVFAYRDRYVRHE